MTFQRRMISAVMLLTILTLGGAFATIALSVNRSQERQLDEALVAEAREEAAEIGAVGGRRLTISARPGPAANDVGPLTKYGAIYDPSGAVVASTSTWRAAPPRFEALHRGLDAPFDLYAQREHLRGVVTRVPGVAGARLLLAAPRTDLDGDARFLQRAMAMVFTVACAWSLGIATWFTRRITRDQLRIMEVAHRAAGGDLSARVAQESASADIAQFGQDLDDTLSRLEAAVDTQQRFIAHAAHELRAPLTALLGEITFTLRREREAHEYRAALQEALGATERLRALSDDLLALARLGATPPAEFGEVALNAVLDGAVADVLAASPQRTRRIRRSPTEWRVYGHANDLRRLVRNLLENALRHSPPEEEVIIEVRAEGECVVLSVDDLGEGLSEEERGRIFEPFYRGASTRATSEQGAGLGLAIATEIAKQHHGSLSCEAGGRGRGARFVVRLPRFQRGGATRGAEQASASPRPSRA